MTRSKNVVTWSAVAACRLIPIAAAFGQQAAPMQVVDDLHADATFANIYVNDSFEAADAIQRARKLTQRGDWEGAARLLQETSDSSGDKLVRVLPGSYVGIREHIGRMIAGWPEVGLAAYRSIYEGKLQSALTDLGERPTVGELLSLFDRFFCTELALELADKIGQLVVESGDLAAAEHVYRRALEEHPSAHRNAQHLRAMLVVLSLMRGDYDVPPSEADTLIHWMGSDRTLREVAQLVREGFSMGRLGATPDSWPVFGGNSERNRRSPTTVNELGLLWRVAPFESAYADSDEPDTLMGYRSKRERAQRLTSQPVAGLGLLFIQRFREVVALHVKTGAVAWRFRADSTGSGTLRYTEEQPPGWDAVTLYEDRLYVSLPGEALPYYSYESVRAPAELACLDAKTGRPVWRLDQQVIEEEFAEVAFDSSPLVRQGRVFVVGRRRRSFGFEDCYLYCFDVDTGTSIYRTHLGSASTGAFGSRQATKSIATMHGDTVYVCTALGTVAAVSGTTGSVQWLRLYERNHGSSNLSAGGAKPWHYNPVIWSAGRLFVLPSDGAALMVLSADNGSILRSVPAASIGHMRTLLGVDGDVVCGVGGEVACYDLTTHALLWSAEPADGAAAHGRGIWSGDRLLIPTDHGLSAFAATDGRQTLARWNAGGDGGNVLALPGQLIVVGADNIAVYVRRADILNALREQMSASPSDPLPALELAEVALSNKEFPDALAVLDSAVRRAEKLGNRLDSSLQRRLFDDLLVCAEQLSAHSLLDPETLKKLFADASQFPPDPAANLAYRFRFATLFEKHNEPARAVLLYQQILRDRLLRELPRDATRKRSESAGTHAERQIDALIRVHGIAIYEPFESEASGLLERGRNTRSVAILARVVTTFPNSQAAPRALIAQGEILANEAHGGEAARLFARALHDYPEQVDGSDLLRRIADAYEAAGMRKQAYRWLTKASRKHPSVRFEFDGRFVTFREYRRRLADVRELVEPSYADVTLPLDHHYERTPGGAIRLLRPRVSHAPRADWSRFFLDTPEGIRAFDSQTGTELWPRPAAVAGEAELLLAGGSLAIFATPYEVFGLEISSGARRWSRGNVPPALDEPEADWEDGEAIRAYTLDDHRIVTIRDNGQLECVAYESGKVLWTRNPRPAPLGLWLLNDSWVVYHVIENDAPVVYLADAGTGERLHTIDTGEKRSLEAVFATIDGQIVVVNSQSISSFEPETGTRRWRMPVHGRVRGEAVHLDVDTLYFSDNDRTVKSIRLDDGRVAWESERLIPRSHDDLSVALAGGSVVVSSSTSISAVDAVAGLTLWRGTTPENSRFVSRLLTRSYVVAIDVPDEKEQRESVAYFYDHRNASGIIPRNGGVHRLGKLEDIREILAVDGGILIQTGTTIQAWVHR